MDMKTMVFMTLLISTAFALDEIPMASRDVSDVYNLVTLYHQDTMQRLNLLETTVKSIKSDISNSTAELINIENQEQQYIENRTQPFNLNMIVIVFNCLMFCVMGILFARHERRLIQQYLPQKEVKP